jgi:hypothetical protein
LAHQLVPIFRDSPNCRVARLSTTQSANANLTNSNTNGSFEAIACDPINGKLYVGNEESPMLIWSVDFVTGIYEVLIDVQRRPDWTSRISEISGMTFDPVGQMLYVLSAANKVIVQSTLNGTLIGTPLNVSQVLAPGGLSFEPTTGDLIVFGAPRQIARYRQPVVPTDAPTKSPSQSPTKSPTKTPTKAASEAPTKAPTMAPTKDPTNAPTTAPNQAPINIPNQSISSRPINTPVTLPVSAPLPLPVAAVPVPVPTMIPLQVPVVAPAPGKVPAPIPTPVPVKSPAIVPIPVPVPITGAPFAPVVSPVKCGVLGFNFFCPRPGRCGFWRRVLNWGGCS